MPDSHHIVFTDEPPIEELIGLLGPAIGRVEDELGIEFDDPQDVDLGGTSMLKLADSDSGDEVAVVDDPDSGRYAAIDGPNAAEIAVILADELPAVPEDELVARAKATGAPRDVLRVAFGQAVQPTPEAERVIATALRSTDSQTIAAAITSAAMTDPRRFTDDLKRLASEAPEAGLKLMAEQALAGGGRF